MPKRGRGSRPLLLHLLLWPSLLLGLYLLTLAPGGWSGVDEAVVQKIAGEHGREASGPLIDPGEGDLLLFLFLMAGAAGGFAAGYYWRDLMQKK